MSSHWDAKFWRGAALLTAPGPPKIYVYWRKPCSLIKGGKPMALCPTRQPCCTKQGRNFSLRQKLQWLGMRAARPMIKNRRRVCKNGWTHMQKPARRVRKPLGSICAACFSPNRAGRAKPFTMPRWPRKTPNWPLRWIAPPKIWRGLMNRSKR